MVVVAALSSARKDGRTRILVEKTDILVMTKMFVISQYENRRLG